MHGWNEKWRGLDGVVGVGSSCRARVDESRGVENASSGLWNVKCQNIFGFWQRIFRDLPEQNRDEQMGKTTQDLRIGTVLEGDRPTKTCPRERVPDSQ